MPTRRYHPHPTAERVDVAGLERMLRRNIRGEVCFDAGARAVWSTDASNFRMPPLGVVQPRDKDDVVAAVAACRDYGAPITNRGGGTSLSGETTNVAVIVDTSRYVTAIDELNPTGRFAWVEPGCINDTLRKAAQLHQLDFGPDPSTHDRCTIGGNIGNNSCGVHSVMAGRTSDNTLGLDVVLYDGTRMTVKSSYDDNEISAVVAGGDRQGEFVGKRVRLSYKYGDLIGQRYPQIPRRVCRGSHDERLPQQQFSV